LKKQALKGRQRTVVKVKKMEKNTPKQAFLKSYTRILTTQLIDYQFIVPIQG
jgi:hypothetical protein